MEKEEKLDRDCDMIEDDREKSLIWQEVPSSPYITFMAPHKKEE